jgi:hypothetical protein
MRRVVVIAVAGLGLAGCSSFSMDVFKSAPPTVTVQLDSVPAGADARTSGGQGCKTPCSVAVPAADFTVSFTLNKFQTVTVPVLVINSPGDFTTPASTSVDPNPVVAELQPAVPPRKQKTRLMRPKPKTPKKPKAAAAPAESPFPAPPGAAPAR